MRYIPTSNFSYVTPLKDRRIEVGRIEVSLALLNVVRKNYLEAPSGKLKTLPHKTNPSKELQSRGSASPWQGPGAHVFTGVAGPSHEAD